VRTIETGEHKPRLETARRLAAALGTSVDVVFPEASDDV
jgi:DNA-binding XRE family transcriptional regulator